LLLGVVTLEGGADKAVIPDEVSISLFFNFFISFLWGE